MKKMKKDLWSLVFSKHTLITVVCTVVVMGAVVAGGGYAMRQHFRAMFNNPEAMVQNQVNHMAKALNLNDSQKAKLQTYLLANFQAMKAERDVMLEKRKNEMKAILTPDQYSKWEARIEIPMGAWRN